MSKKARQREGATVSVAKGVVSIDQVVGYARRCGISMVEAAKRVAAEGFEIAMPVQGLARNTISAAGIEAAKQGAISQRGIARQQMASSSLGARLAGMALGGLVGGIVPELVAQGIPLDESKLALLRTVEPRKVSRPVPDMVQVITAWRAWGVTSDKSGWRLKALGKSLVWEPKQRIDAICDASVNHPAPSFDCTCGIWSFKDLDRLVAAVGNYNNIKVLGQVSLWGKVIETENGYRAQYAYPSELWLMDSSLDELGFIYDVPVRTL